MTKDVQTNVSTTLGKATASAEQWAVGTANVQTMVVAEAVASALAVSIANSFQYIKEQAKDKSACSVDVQSVRTQLCCVSLYFNAMSVNLGKHVS